MGEKKEKEKEANDIESLFLEEYKECILLIEHREVKLVLS